MLSVIMILIFTMISAFLYYNHRTQNIAFHMNVEIFAFVNFLCGTKRLL